MQVRETGIEKCEGTKKIESRIDRKTQRDTEGHRGTKTDRQTDSDRDAGLHMSVSRQMGRAAASPAGARAEGQGTAAFA